MDSSGVINARDRVLQDDFIAPPEIKNELKDLQARMKFEAAVSEGRIRLEDPPKGMVKKIREVAEYNGVLPLLSDTDTKVIALAYEKKLPIVTDDYDIQNMCLLLGLKFETVVMRGIKEPFAWKKKCTACGREFKQDVAECEACGSERFSVEKRT